MFEKFRHAPQISSPALIALSFFLAIILGTILLCLPIATHTGYISFIDALFTATSATCVTGLIVVDTGTYFTLFGQLVILALLQVGGLGIMTLSTFFAVLLGKRISMKNKLIMQDALDYFQLDNIGKLIKHILLLTFGVELLGAVSLFMRWRHIFDYKRAAYYAVFHSVSAFCNAGFSLFPDSLVSFKQDTLINVSICALIVIGGLGFVVLLDIVRFSSLKLKGDFSRFSLQSKVVLVTSGILVLGGALLIFLLEYNSILADFCLKDKLLVSFFQSITCRTAGFNTIPIGALGSGTLAICIVLMYIGASPQSTGGGIKTTTFAIFISTLRSLVYGHEDINLFKRRIPKKTVHKAASIIGLSVLLLIAATIGLIVTEKNQAFAYHGRYALHILFEAVSAFGTVGLSTGITPMLSSIGRIVITLMMFIGRIGPLTMALAISHMKPTASYKYPKGKITAG